MMPAANRPLVRPSFALVLALLGAVTGYGAMSALMEGRPENGAVRGFVIVAFGAFPASVILALPIFGLGLTLLIFRATRKSGVLLASYAASYLAGGGTGIVLFLLAHRIAR